VRALGLDDRFIRLWRFYFAYCEAGFLERQVNVVQMVFAGRGWRGSPQRP
jgi:cyclopropane-fatty-acyl-phospholipid synthase